MVLPILMGSCGNSRDVVSKRWIQKRKYRKGFHLNRSKSLKQDEGKPRHYALRLPERTDSAVAQPTLSAPASPSQQASSRPTNENKETEPKREVSAVEQVKTSSRRNEKQQLKTAQPITHITARMRVHHQPPAMRQDDAAKPNGRIYRAILILNLILLSLAIPAATTISPFLAIFFAFIVILIAIFGL
ncbi:MAG: hypothetical protein AAGB22_12860 [Bacteroidota bacterium]